MKKIRIVSLGLLLLLPVGCDNLVSSNEVQGAVSTEFEQNKQNLNLGGVQRKAQQGVIRGKFTEQSGESLPAWQPVPVPSLSFASDRIAQALAPKSSSPHPEESLNSLKRQTSLDKKGRKYEVKYEKLAQMLLKRRAADKAVFDKILLSAYGEYDSNAGETLRNRILKK